MPFGIDVDFDKAKKEIADFLKTFGLKYTKNFGIALVNKVMNDMVESEKAEEKEDFQLKKNPLGGPPPKEGNMKRRSNVLGRWKAGYFWINERYELVYGVDDKKEKTNGTINLWGYKVQGLAVRPEGARRGGPEWVPDEERPNCTSCNKAFSAVVWHHHCRECGEVFCGDCSPNKLPMQKFGYEKPQRVCNGCYEKLGGGRDRATTFAVEDDEEKEDTKFFGIQLLHINRLPYILECETSQDKKEWMDALKICCGKAEPPINPDPVQASAFEAAHKAISWENGNYGFYRITGSEGEMLADLVTDRVFKVVIEPALAAVPENLSPKAVRMAKNVIDRNVKTMVRTLVAPAWQAITNAAAGQQAKLEEKIKPLVAPIKDGKQKVLDKMQAGVMKVLDPVMEKTGKAAIDKAMPIISAPIIKAHSLAFEALNAEIERFSADKFNDDVDEAINATPAYYGFLKDVNEHLDAFKNDFKDVVAESEFMQHVSATTTVRYVDDSIKDLVENALYTLKDHPSLKDGADQDKIKAAWKDVSAAVLHDSNILVVNTFKDLLNTALVAPVQDKLLGSDELKAVLDPLDALIPDAVSEFISITGMLEELVGNVCDAAVSKAVESGSGKTKDELSQAMAGLAI